MLDQAVKDTGYSRIDIVKIAYMDSLVAKRQAQAVRDAFEEKLPKHSYGKRINGKKLKNKSSAIRTGVKKLDNRLVRNPSKDSKYAKMFNKMLESQQKYSAAYERFQALAKQLTPEEQQAILGGYDLPVNVMATKPGRQSILTQINSSTEQ